MWENAQHTNGQADLDETIDQLRQQLELERKKNVELTRQLILLEQGKRDSSRENLLKPNHWSELEMPKESNQPIMLWEEDFSPAFKFISALNRRGITDLRDYFRSRPDEMENLLRKISVTPLNHVSQTLADSRKAQNLLELLHPNTFEQIIDFFYAIQKKQYYLNSKTSFQTKHGKTAFFSAQLTVISGFEHDYSRVIVAVTNITETRQTELKLQETNRQLTNLIGNLNGMVYRCLYDQNWTMLFVSNPVVELTGYLSQEILYNNKISYAQLVHPCDLVRVSKTIQTAVESDQRFTVEYRIRTKSGEEKWVWEQGIGLKNREGKLEILEGCILDITDRKNAEAARVEIEEKFKKSFQFSSSLILISTADEHSRILEANERFEQVTGWKKKEYLNMSTLDIGIWADLKDREEYIHLLKTEGGVKNKEYDFRLKSGEVRNGLVSGQLMHLKQGTVVLGIITDITEQKNARIKLDNERLHLRTVIETIPDLIWLKDLDGNYLNCNPRFEQFFGAKEAEIIGKTDYDFVGKELADSFRKNDLAAMHANQPTTNLEWVTFASDGHRAFLETVKTPMRDANGKLIGVLGIARDITKTKQQEEDLRLSKNWYKAIFNNTGTATCIINKDSEIILMNDMFMQLTGYTETDLANKVKWIEFIAPEDLKRMQQFHQDRRETGKNPPKQYEFKLISKHGNQHQILLNVDLIPGTSMSVASLLDISIRVKALNELKQSQEKYQNLVENINDVIYELDGNWRITYISPSVQAVTGFKPESYLGKYFMEVVVPEDQASIQEIHIKFLETKTIGPFTFRIQTKDKQLVWIRISARPVFEGGQFIGSRGVAMNVTKQKAIEAELIQAKEEAEQANHLKSAFLATMSHELRTPLNAIIGFSQLMDHTVPQKDMIEMGQIIFNSGNHLLSIIESILNLTMLQSRRVKRRTETFFLSDLQKTLQFYLESELSKHKKPQLTSQFQLLEDSQKIELTTDKTRLTQLLTNLIGNAVKYSEKGVIRYTYKVEDQDIVFCVEDEGIGIPPDKLDIIFDRFRQVDDTSTRRHGGVGLGLAICKEIAELLKGDIWVESKHRQGSSFYFRLPGVVKKIGH